MLCRASDCLFSYAETLTLRSLIFDGAKMEKTTRCAGFHGPPCATLKFMEGLASRIFRALIWLWWLSKGGVFYNTWTLLWHEYLKGIISMPPPSYKLNLVVTILVAGRVFCGDIKFF